MRDKDILEFSKKTKADAVALLNQTNLINILKSFGEVIIQGSFEYDLMWGADIDIVVVCKDTKKLSLEALNKVIKAKLAQKYEYGDFVTFKREKRPESYILNLLLPFKGRRWEIEIWFFKEIPETQIETNKLIEAKLNEENKITILEMKKKREEHGNTKHQISSTEIYKKVLIDGIKNFEDLV